MTASAVPSTAIPKRKVTAAPKMDPIEAMSPSPHQDDRLLKIPIKNDRIFGYNELCTKSGAWVLYRRSMTAGYVGSYWTVGGPRSASAIARSLKSRPPL